MDRHGKKERNPATARGARGIGLGHLWDSHENTGTAWMEVDPNEHGRSIFPSKSNVARQVCRASYYTKKLSLQLLRRVHRLHNCRLDSENVLVESWDFQN